MDGRRRLGDVHAESSEAADIAAGWTPFEFEAAFQSHYPRIARDIARVIGDPARAEELAVEAFWKLWRHPRAQGPASGGWLHQTAIHLALDELRRRARRQRYERWFGHFHRAAPASDELLAATEEQRRVRAVLARMNRRQSALLLLSGDDAAYAELAATLSINPNSVGTLLRRARAAFEAEYVRRYGEPSR